MELGGKKPERVKILRSHLSEGNGAAGEVLAAEGNTLSIACGSGAIKLIQVQRAGKKAMSTEEFLRGSKLSVGETVS